MTALYDTHPSLPMPQILQRRVSAARISIAPRVLLVEDNPITQLVTLQQLRDLGCFSRGASFGHEALEAHQHDLFDLVLLDCHLPDMDGYAIARKIREVELAAAQHHVAIVAVTADDDRECEQKCISAGMDAFIQKPISLATLRSLLQRYAS